MNQLERDLRRHIREKLNRWMNDAIELYDMAELPADLAVAAGLDALMRSLATGLALSEIDPNEAGHALAEMIRRRRKQFEQEDLGAEDGQ